MRILNLDNTRFLAIGKLRILIAYQVLLCVDVAATSVRSVDMARRLLDRVCFLLLANSLLVIICMPRTTRYQYDIA